MKCEWHAVSCSMMQCDVKRRGLFQLANNLVALFSHGKVWRHLVPGCQVKGRHVTVAGRETEGGEKNCDHLICPKPSLPHLSCYLPTYLSCYPLPPLKPLR